MVIRVKKTCQRAHSVNSAYSACQKIFVKFEQFVFKQYVKERPVRSFRKGHKKNPSGVFLLRPIECFLTEISNNQWDNRIFVVAYDPTNIHNFFISVMIKK